MRDYNAIITDIEKRMSEKGLHEDLKNLREEMQSNPPGYHLWSDVGTWLATFHIVSDFDERLDDLIEEYFKFCHSNGIFLL